MNHLKSFSKKSFFLIAFLLLCMTAAADAGLFFGFDFFSETAVPGRNAFLKTVLPVSGGLWLFFSILIWASVKSMAAGLSLSVSETPAKAETPAEEKKRMEDQQKRLFLHLLSVLQRDARLIDFFAEKLEQFDDAQIGAAVRNIHENSAKTLEKYLAPEPVINESEGSEVTIEKGFDPASVKLTGNVTGEPPFKGILRHRGWQAASLELPLLSDRANSLLIAPAEVEIR